MIRLGNTVLTTQKEEEKLKLEQVVILNNYAYVVKKGSGGYYLHNDSGSNVKMFRELGIYDPHKYLQQAGFAVSNTGVFPYVPTLEMLQSIIEFLEYLFILKQKSQ